MTPRPSKFLPELLTPENSLSESSDDALALEFSAKHANDLRFISEIGRWHRWNGQLWEPDTTSHVFELSRLTCRTKSAACIDERLASRIASAATIAAVERLARADRRHAATLDQWNSDPWLLNTPGGVVDLRTGNIRATTREDYMTKLTAAAPGGPITLWKSFLDRITGSDKDLQAFIQRMCGYALTGITREHALFFL
jgi:putative DNA primase/helicase